MKIHRVVQMLGATTSTGKLADDMYALGHKDYYSEAEDRYIPISHMDFQHMVRAFVKQNDEDVRTDTQEGKCADLTKVNAELRFQIEQVDRNQTVSKEAYDIAWDNNKMLKKQVEHWKKLAEDNFISSVNDSETSDTWKDRYDAEVKNAEYWKAQYRIANDFTLLKGHGYVFSEIPNDCDGQRFTDGLKQYLNKESYKMRIRGQYLKDEVKETEGWRKYERGQPIEHSKALRVYIDKK
mgnify:CR=1 FL=1